MVLLFVLVVLLNVLSPACSSDVLSWTRSRLVVAEQESRSGLGRSSRGPPRTSFYKALTDIEQSIKYAEAKFSPSSTDKSSRNLIEIRKSIISAAKSGNYRIGREIFGFYQYLEDCSSHSKSKKKMKRSTNDIISYIKTKLGDKTFKEFFNIESGTTLTFVLDTTGSMKEDIQQVRNIVRALSTPANEVGDEESGFDMGSGFYTFLLAPFKDPDYGPLETYADKGELLSALEELSVDGGGDCNEMVMHGISEGLHETEAYSPVFVFTDAGSKDLDEKDSVMTLSQMLYSPLYFFLTPSPECDKDISEYEDLALETSGQVLLLDKEEIRNMSDFVRSTGVGRADIISGTERSGNGSRDKRGTGQKHNIQFDVDDTVDTLVVTVNFRTNTGSSYLLTPDDNLIIPKFVSAVTNMRLYEIHKPQPGIWLLKAITDIGDKFTYKVNSVSPTNIDFDFYFLVEQQSGKLVPAKHATPGKTMKLKLNILGGADLIKPDRSIVFLVDTKGNVISTIQTLSLSKYYDYQYDGVFIVPDESFKVMVYGETQSGNPFTRTSQATITPSYGCLQASRSVIKYRMIRPGSSGHFHFKFQHFSEKTTDFRLSFSNPGDIITESSPLFFPRLKSGRRKIMRLPYNVPYYVPDGTEYRISLVVDGGEVKSTYVHTIIITRFAPTR